MSHALYALSTLNPRTRKQLHHLLPCIAPWEADEQTTGMLDWGLERPPIEVAQTEQRLGSRV